MDKITRHKTLLVAAAAAIVIACALAAWGPTSLDLPGDGAMTGDEPSPAAPVAPQIFRYLEVTGSCGPYFDRSPCVNMRSGPGLEHPVVSKLRNGVVLRVAETVSGGGRDWYRIAFDDVVRYPERVDGDWYVAADPESVRLFEDASHREATPDEVAALAASSTKRIVVDRSDQTLYAYDGDVLFAQKSVSTGLELTPTPRGAFAVYQKTPSRYMQGPLPGISDQYYDLPGVPWSLYFTYQGAVIHGAYWHDHFGEPWSHGCVNLATDEARKLYEWADVGTPVLVRD